MIRLVLRYEHLLIIEASSSIPLRPVSDKMVFICSAARRQNSENIILPSGVA